MKLNPSLILLILVAPNVVKAQTIDWQGYKWHVKSAHNEGPGPNNWDASNVWVDAKGLLHLRIARVRGHWSCAEIWTDENLGFGTYECQVEGRLDKLDPNVIFSMFSYAGPDGVKEIDVEYAKWGNPKDRNLWWTVYPNDSQAKKADKGFNFDLDGSYTTSRYNWSREGVHYWMLGGHQPLGSLKNLMFEWDYRPLDYIHAVPQDPIPLHFNLWLFQGKVPSDGNPVEVVVHRFKLKSD